MVPGSGSNDLQMVILADAGRAAFGGYRRSKISTLEIIGVTIFIIVFGISKISRIIQEKKALESHFRKKQTDDSAGLSPSGPPPDIAQWRKAASELSGTMTGPHDKTGRGLAITGKIDHHPFRIDFRGNDKIFYSLTLPFAPAVENRTIPIRCVSEKAVIGENMIFLLCSGTTPRTAVIRELAAHAGRFLATIPFEDESDEDKPEAILLRKQNAAPFETAPAQKTGKPVFPAEPVALEPEPAIPEPVVLEPEPATPEPLALEPKPATPEPLAIEPEPAIMEQRKGQEPPAAQAPAADSAGTEADEISPEILAERLFRSTLPGPEEKAYFTSLVGRRVEWTGTIRMAYEISSDFVFGRGKGVKVQMDLCTVAGKYGRQTLRATALFPPESYAVLRSASNKTIRFRGTILKLESFSREVYLSQGELL